MPPRKYSSQAVETTLNGNISAGATTMVVASVTGFPSTFPYTLVIDKGTSSEELVEVTAAGGTTLTVTRAIDGSTALAHQNAARVVHAVTARDLREPQDHIYATNNVHGVSGTFVDTASAQTLAGPKTLTSPIINGGTQNSPTLVTPTIANFTNAQHLHNGADQGGFVVMPRIRVYRNAVTSVATGVWVDTVWENTDVEDPASWWSSGAQVNCPYNGFYLIAGGCKLRNGVDGKNRELAIRRASDDVELGNQTTSQAGAFAWTPMSAIAMINVTVGTGFKLSVKHDNGSNIDVSDYWMAAVCLMRY